MSDFSKNSADLHIHLKRNMLEFHCAQALFCPGCRRSMDARNAVAADFYQGSELAKTGVMCSGCYDKRATDLEAIALKRGLRLEITDGRLLFPPRQKVRRAGRVK